MCLKTLVIFNSEIKNTTNTGMEGRALMLTERLKRLSLSTSKWNRLCHSASTNTVIGYLISLAHLYGELIFYWYPSII